MKKILLFGISMTFLFNAFGQSLKPAKQVIKSENGVIKGTPSTFKMNAKKTRGGSRLYSIVDATDASLNGSMLTNFATTVNSGIIWQDSTMKALYGVTGGGVAQEAIWIQGYGQVIDPAAFVYNDPAVYAGEIEISRGKSYVVDSVGVICIYERNPAKASIVDTLIISVANSSDLFQIPETQTIITSKYGTDTLFNADYSYNFTTRAIKGTSTIIKKIPLTAASANDTTAGGWNYFETNIGQTVAATGLNLAAVSVMFKSGDTWTPNVDSCGSGTNVLYNRFRLVSFEEADNTYRSYTKKDYNSSQLFGTDTSGWGEDFIPSFYFTSTSYGYEHHWIQWKLTCATCNPVGINDVASIIEVSVSPNPAQGNVALNLNLKESAKNVTVDFTNAVGQVIKKVNLGAMTANIARKEIINISDLSSGLYFYTVNADGQKISNKLMVK